uniref:N-CoR GPS2-interacting domain-containing protein n=1 Tax=Cyprinus carpio TaxID=7962 RepID=A0A8C1NNU6_CYPCA
MRSLCFCFAQCFLSDVCVSVFVQEFPVSDYRTPLQDQQRRRPSLLSEFHPGTERPPERRHGYEQQFHAIPAQQEQETLEAKRPRIENVSETHFSRAQPTGIESQFSVKVEASSPGGVPQVGEDADTSPSKLSKEELIQSMDRVDREIAKVEQQIFKLKKKQVCSLTKHRCTRET